MNTEDKLKYAPVDAGLENLTDWSNPPSIRDLKADFEEAKSDHHLHIAKVSDWLDNLHTRGKAQVKTAKGRSALVPKVIRKQAEWRYSSLADPFLSTDDVFNVAPVTFEDREGARQNELLLNYQFNHKLKKTRFIDEYVRTAVDEGTVIVRVGWDFEEEEQLVQEPIVEPRLINGQVQMVQVGTREVPTMVTIKNEPTAEIVDYRNLTIDPTCNGDFDKARFAIYSFETDLSELQKDGKYSNLDRIKTEDSNPLAEPDYPTDNVNGFTFNDKPRQKFVAHEYWGYWDIEGTGVVEPIVATWVGDVLIRMDRNPFPDQGLPFIFVSYLPVRGSVYGEPDGALLEENQKVIGAVTRGMIDVMGRSANGQQGYRKDALDVTNRRKFEKGDDYEYNAGIDPRLAFHMHTFPEIPQSAQLMLQLQNNEAESLTGVKAFTNTNTGISGQALGQTATGIRSALDAASKRELAILRRLADGIIQVGKKFVAMNAAFLEDEEIIRVTNDFVAIQRESLAGEFDLKLSISTAEEDNNKANDLTFLLQTMGNTVPFGLTKLLLAEAARLRKMPDLAKQLEQYEPEPDPLEQQKKMLEIELLKAQIASELAQAQENRAEAQLDSARAQTELAKARNLESDTDLKNLEFVEQESGVHQERELQKLGEQAKANAKLEAVKQHLAPNKPQPSN